MRAQMIYFNEIDPVACAALTYHGGYVDPRSIKEVQAHDVADYSIAHFFAGAGLWEVARRMAQWPDRRPLWTASCPCQPFSVAGKGLGTDDPRHLWPDLLRLVHACRPPCIVGEQVAGKAGDAWLDGVGANLESEGYAFRAVEVPASAVDAPHKRSRNWWVASTGAVAKPNVLDWRPGAEGQNGAKTRLIYASPQADADSSRRGGRSEDEIRPAVGRDASQWADGELGDARGTGLAFRSVQDDERRTLWDKGATSGEADYGSFWMDAEWLNCADGKARRAKPDLRLLVDGMAGRADLWRLAGNSIVPQVAAEVLRATMSVRLAQKP